MNQEKPLQPLASDAGQASGGSVESGERQSAPTEIPMAGGVVSSSAIDPLHLIPTAPLMRLARRFQLGIDRKGDRAWNALSNNDSCLQDRAFVLERIAHVIKHALLLRDKVKAGTPLDGDDDAAAIAWSGVFLCAATEALNKREDKT